MFSCLDWPCEANYLPSAKKNKKSVMQCNAGTFLNVNDTAEQVSPEAASYLNHYHCYNEQCANHRVNRCLFLIIWFGRGRRSMLERGSTNSRQFNYLITIKNDDLKLK